MSRRGMAYRCSTNEVFGPKNALSKLMAQIDTAAQVNGLFLHFIQKLSTYHWLESLFFLLFYSRCTFRSFPSHLVFFARTSTGKRGRLPPPLSSPTLAASGRHR